jgi:diguanylate cyclase
MKASTGTEIDRTFQVARRALELMQAYGSSASPRSYEVWYAYVSGHKPLMNDAIKQVAAKQGSLSDEDIERLHAAHLGSRHFTDEAERTGGSVLLEIDQVMELLDLALGSTAKYGRSLAVFTKDLAAPIDRDQLRKLLETLARATREVSVTNMTLEARLKEARGEMEALREGLETVRRELMTDPLTGLSNRKHFEEMLGKVILHAAAQKTPLALILLDVDHFKRFNDTYGHLTGDQVLKLVGVTMRECVTGTATLARFGGEEFGILLPETTVEAARAAAEKVRESVMRRELVKRSTGESLGKVTVSMGVAVMRPGDTAISLLERADQCMYVAKGAGRNRTVTDAEQRFDGGLPDAA